MKSLRYIFWILLFVAFVIFGLHVRRFVIITGASEVFGYDYERYMGQMRSVDWITYTGFRHPGLGLILSPFVVVASIIAKISSIVCDVYLVCLMAAVCVINVWLIKKIAGWFAVALFLSFGFTWILASVPESFPFAMTSLLLVVVVCKEEVRRQDVGENPLPVMVWALLAFLTSAVTITNGLKVMIAYLICNWRAIKAARVRFMERELPLLLLFPVGVAFVVSMVGLFFAIRMWQWNAAHADSQKTITAALVQTMGWIPEGLGLGGRVKGMIVNFVAIPFLPRICNGPLIIPVAPSAIGLTWSMGIFILSLACGVMNRRMKIVQAMAGMFIVDFFIHIIFGWGLDEGWIFCAHWFWIVPILISLRKVHLSRMNICQLGGKGR